MSTAENAWEVPGLPRLAAIDDGTLDPDLVEHVPVEWARSRQVLPVRLADGRLAIVGGPGATAQAYEDLSALLEQDAEWMSAEPDVLRAATDKCYFKRSGVPGTAGGAATASQVAPAADATADGPRSDDLLSASEDAPVARYVNGILLEAVRKGASDIHFEPFADRLAVRYRIDGLLYEQPSPPRHLEDPITARLKVMARLDLAEKRLPQDGVARLRVGAAELDVRVSSVPVAEGERIVLRLLHRESTRYSLSELGMAPALLESFHKILRSPHGIVLVTGPTGSGKTTTLYAALRELDTAHLNVLTIEDPIEYQLDGIGQIQVHPQIGLTFASGLRHILRQDPDVVLVGETRDLETAEIVTRASLTGHLVFTTLHTNDAAGAVSRLTDMGVPPYLLGAAARAILAQRLVRRLCPYCRTQQAISASEAEALGRPGLAGAAAFAPSAAGCPHCLGGYKGRTGIHELLPVTPAVAEAIRLSRPAAECARLAAEAGYRPMLDDGIDKILDGVTSVAEVLRATGGQPSGGAADGRGA